MALMLWIPIWLIAFFVAFDLTLLGVRPQIAEVSMIGYHRSTKGGKVCHLTLKPTSEFHQTRNVNNTVCAALSEGDVVKLYKSRLLERWVEIKLGSNKSAPGLVENAILNDLIFIVAALVLPFALKHTTKEPLPAIAWITLALLMLGSFYYLSVFIR